MPNDSILVKNFSLWLIYKQYTHVNFTGGEVMRYQRPGKVPARTGFVRKRIRRAEKPGLLDHFYRHSGAPAVLYYLKP